MKGLAIVGTLAVLSCAGLLLKDDIRELAADRGGRCGPPREPVWELFDADQDEVLSADEIENATAALTTWDANQDGMLTPDELPGPRHPHRGRAGHDQKQRPQPGPDGQTGPRRPAWDAGVSSVEPGTVILEGGNLTDHRDGGRPVALIAAALDVTPDVFREAFRNVQPSRLGPPTAFRAQANKRVLMDALSRWGVTNDRLDEVSDYYRYRPEQGEFWPHEPARARAVIEDGQVTGIELLAAGHGYLSAPRVTIIGFEDVRVDVQIGYSTQFARNGRVASLQIADAQATEQPAPQHLAIMTDN
ncbi:MAG: hypothetical protein NXI04_00460 [Planctomycetaceae bacterium]|nr:hypothetical protein [Planctomycetaceae bacterium]